MADVERVPRRLRPALVASGLLLLVMAAAMMSGPRATRLPLPEVSRPGQPAPAEPLPAAPTFPTPTPLGPAELGQAPAWLTALVLVVACVVGAALLAGLVILLRLYVRRARGWRTPAQDVTVATGEAPSTTAEEVRAAVAAGLAALADDAEDPRPAVIGCWLRLETAAAAAGHERRPDDTPADLVARLLTSQRVSPQPLDELARLYRYARFAPGDVDEEMRVRARTTLTRIQGELLPREKDVPVRTAGVVGGSSALEAEGTRRGRELEPGEDAPPGDDPRRTEDPEGSVR